MTNVWIGTDLHLWNDRNDQHHIYRSDANLRQLMDQYNKDIQAGDLFIYLGDLYDPGAVDDKRLAQVRTFISSIPAHKVMCKGNRDTQDDSYYLDLGFDEVCDVAIIHSIVLSHKPVYVEPNMINVHGHLHNEKPSNMTYQHINAYDFEQSGHPILLDDLIDQAVKAQPIQSAEDAIHQQDQRLYQSLDGYTTYQKILDLTDCVQLFPVDEAVNAFAIKDLEGIQTPEELSNWMKRNIHYAPFTRLKTDAQLIKTGTGSCHDQVAFEFPRLRSMDVNPKILFMYTYKEGESVGGMTHSLVYWTIENGTTYWFENAWVGAQGIHKFDSIDALKKDLTSRYQKMPIAQRFPEIEFVNVGIRHYKAGVDLKTLVNSIFNNDENVNESVVNYNGEEHAAIYSNHKFTEVELNAISSLISYVVQLLDCTQREFKVLARPYDEVKPLLDTIHILGRKDPNSEYIIMIQEEDLPGCLMYTNVIEAVLIQYIIELVNPSFDATLAAGIAYYWSGVWNQLITSGSYAWLNDAKYRDIYEFIDALVTENGTTCLRDLILGNTSITEATLSRIEQLWDPMDEVLFADTDDTEYWEQDDDYKPSKRKKEPMADGEGDIQNESKIEYINDKGEKVPEICPKCGSKVGVFLRGEPVFLCSNKKCNKYFGTVPCNISESVRDLAKAGKAVNIYRIHTVSANDEMEPAGAPFANSVDSAVDNYRREHWQTKEHPTEAYVHVPDTGYYDFRMSDEYSDSWWCTNDVPVRMIGKIKINDDWSWEWIEQYNDNGTLVEAAHKQTSTSVLYHGSSNKHSVILANSPAGNRNCAYGTPNYNFALAYAGKQWNDLDINQSMVNNMMVLTEIVPGAFNDIFSRSGYIHYLPSDDFEQFGSHKYEYVCPHDVKPIKVEHVSNVLKALKDRSDVKLYYYPDLPDFIKSRAEYVQRVCNNNNLRYDLVVKLLIKKGAKDLSSDGLSEAASESKPAGYRSIHSFKHKVCDEGEFAHWKEQFPEELSQLDPDVNTTVTLWMTKNESKLVAYIALEQKGDQTVMKSMKVFPDYQSYGLDKQLMKYAKINGATLLYVNPSNKTAVELYKSCGWKFAEWKNRGMVQPMVLDESYTREEDQIEFNVERWAPGGNHNIMYITGLSGSGKSTLGRKLAKKYNATYVSLDHFTSVCRKGPEHLAKKKRENDWSDLEIIELYFKAHPEGYIPNGTSFNSLNDISRDIVGEYYLKYSNWLRNTLHNGKFQDKLFVVEGFQIYEFESAELYEHEPVVVKSPSVLTTLIRREKRGLGRTKEEYPDITNLELILGTVKDTVNFAIPMYIKEAPKINKFRSDLIRMNEAIAETHPMDRAEENRLAAKYDLNPPGHYEYEKEEAKQKNPAKERADKLREQRNRNLKKARKVKKRKAFVRKVKSKLPFQKKNEEAAVDDQATSYNEPEMDSTPVGDRIRFFNQVNEYPNETVTGLELTQQNFKSMKDLLDHFNKYHSHGPEPFIGETYQFELEDKTLRFNEPIIESSTNGDKLYPVYVMLIHSGTLLANVIKTVTNSKFSHSSISFDSSMRNMYSFGRKSDTNPFIGAFKKEDIQSEFYKEKEIPYALYVVPVTEDELARMKKRLNYFIANSTKFKYDFTGLMKNYFGIADNPEYKWFCSRFVADILNAGAPAEHPYVMEPSLMRPEDFQNTNFAIYVTGGYLSSYDKTLVDKITNRILRTERIRRAKVKAVQAANSVEALPVAESAILDLDPFDPFQESVLNYQLSLMNESQVDQFIDYLKSFKVRFDKEGNVIITRREYDQLDLHFRQSLKMIKAYENAGNLQGVKDELCKIRYMIELINQHYLNPRTKSSTRTKQNMRKEMMDLRSVMLNAFQQHLKYVTVRDPQFNFQKAYDTSKYGKETEIPKSLLSTIGKTLITKLQ